MSKKSDREAWATNGLEDWGSYMAAKKAKLEDQFQEMTENEFQHATDIFKGIAIFVNGYTSPCADQLKRLMMEHGGVYHHYIRSHSTTHLIASNLTYAKIIQYRKSKHPLPLCKPEWITDSIKANKLLDWRPYLLYSSATVTQPQLQFGKGDEKNSTKQDSEEIESNEIHSDGNSGNANSCTAAFNTDESVKLKGEETKSRNQAMCSKNVDFLAEFYNNSRLHHISTMGATFKEYVNELRLKNNGSFPGLDRLKNSSNNLKINPTAIPNDSDSDEDILESRISNKVETKNESIIMHIDMDCFFVSVGLRNHPELRGQPVAVTHAKGNRPQSSKKEDDDFGSMSEIASCSYEARKSGLKNGMFLGQALKLCPNLKTIKYDFEGYKEVSYTLYNTVASYTLDIEAVSCDEMYADITKVLSQFNLTPIEFATIIRDEIKEKTGCPVSTGFGSNKLQARLATKKAKPDGHFHLKNRDVQSYIGAVSVRDIPGVGYATMQQLRKINVETCMDLQNISIAVLQKEFGKKTGEMLYNTCRGIDNSKLNIEHIRKSVSAEVNYGIRFEHDNDARTFLSQLSKEVCNRLVKIASKGRCLTLKLMVRAKDAPKDPAKFMGHGMCDNFTKSKNFMTPIDNEDIITKEVLSLWDQMQQPPEDIRGIGIQVSRLETMNVKKANTNMMKFIAKGKSETGVKIQHDKQVYSRHPVNINKNPQVKTTSGSSSERNDISKPQGLKAFFTTKKSSTVNPKAGPSHFIDPSHIDKSVLAELPEDIRKEILEFEKLEMKKKESRETTSVEINGSKTSQIPLKDESTTLSQDISRSVPSELSVEMRDEIGSAKPVTKKTEPTVIVDYFKHKKPGTYSKPKMPTIQEIDMAVLVELPDDIRNEILNEYKKNKEESVDAHGSASRGNAQETFQAKTDSHQSKKQILDENNLSFSQVDPDFLAALDEDIRADVRLYCKVKKKETELKLEKLLNEKPQSSHQLKTNKRGRKPKNIALKNINKFVTKNDQQPRSDGRITIDKTENNIDRKIRNTSFLEHKISTLQKDGPDIIDRRDAIRSHHFNFSRKKIESDSHQEMLTALVNRLFSLPVQQVKNQLQTWIKWSDSINELDLLSIATYLSMLPKEKRIEDLHVLMKTMQRCMTETGSCVWHETYRKTVEHVQHYMQIEYNSKLILPSIRCNFCERKATVHDNL